MRLISRVAVKSFRSIRGDTIEDLGDFTAFAGLNNSGKSNVLRALNAFFSGETDPGVAVNVDNDFFRPDLKKKKAKRIRVTVTFSLPISSVFEKGYSLFRKHSEKTHSNWPRSGRRENDHPHTI
jgi:AAA15 family ATPase/GTPase